MSICPSVSMFFRLSVYIKSDGSVRAGGQRGCGHEIIIRVALKNKCFLSFFSFISFLLLLCMAYHSGWRLTHPPKLASFQGSWIWIYFLTRPFIRPHATLNCFFHIASTIAAFYFTHFSHPFISSHLSPFFLYCPVLFGEKSARCSFLRFLQQKTMTKTLVSWGFHSSLPQFFRSVGLKENPFSPFSFSLERKDGCVRACMSLYKKTSFAGRERKEWLTRVYFFKSLVSFREKKQ